MRHIVRISKETPAQAAFWQEVMCQFSQAMVDLLALKGGDSPILSFLEEKCDLPEAT